MILATLFMGLAAYNIHNGWYGCGTFFALAALPYLIEMGMQFFVAGMLKEYIIMPIEKARVPKPLPQDEEN